MEKRRKIRKQITSMEENKVYLHKLFTVVRDMEVAMHAHRPEGFSNTEIHLMSEIICAADNGERLISTRLADRLGITRSAVSQIVSKLEKEGVVRRVPDETDKKIAYVEMTEKAAEAYSGIMEQYANFVGKVIVHMGIAKLNKMFALVEEFYDAVEEACLDCECKKRQ
ncbi:MAG: MarR family transcriptional regulator [Clostridia bacterium]|nr:MarR family transcriptional regulator [Clostridia bacterium]